MVTETLSPPKERSDAATVTEPTGQQCTSHARRTLADLVSALGVSPERIWLDPQPGTATVEVAVSLGERKEAFVEVVDGTLVERAMGWTEEFLATELSGRMGEVVRRNKVSAFVVGGQGYAMAGEDRRQMRVPDVGVFLFANFPENTDFGDIAVADHPADLAVEVLSKGNTAAEMDRKRNEYFAAGTSIVWIADHRKRTVEIWTSPKSMTIATDGDVLDGGSVLPGFELSVTEWFDSVRPRSG